MSTTVARFLTYKELSDAVIAAIKTASPDVFKAIVAVAATDYKPLLEIASNITGTPKSLICFGEENFEDRGLVRRLTVAVVVFSANAGRLDAKASSVWDLMHAAVKPFLPVVDPEQPTVPPAKIVLEDAAEITPSAWTPLPVPSGAAAALELEIVEAMAWREQ